MRKNKFFDTIMIALVLMTCFKLLYPDAFTFNVTVNTSSIDSSQGSQDELDLPEFSSIQDAADYFFGSSSDFCTSDDDAVPCGDIFYCPSSSAYLCSFANEECFKFSSDEPVFYINGVLWYEYSASAIPDFDISSGYYFESPSEWISDVTYI